MNTQYRKNLKAVLEANKTYCDESIESLKWELGTYDLSVDTNTNTAHIKQLPSDAIQTTVAQVDGVGYKVNQLFSQNLNTTYNGIVVSRSGNYMLLNGTATSTSYPLLSQSITFQQGHKYLYVVQTISGSKTGEVVINTYSVDHSSHNLPTYIVNATYQANNYGLYLTFPEGASADNWLVCCNVFDLTSDFGSGNEPSTVSDCATEYAKRGIDIYSYTPQQSSIKNNAFTGVTIKDSNDNITETISVDLTTIKDSNNVSLFPSGKMMGNSNVADFITPYNQESRYVEIKPKNYNWIYNSTYGYFYVNISSVGACYRITPNLLSNNYETVETLYTASQTFADKSITFLRDGNPQAGTVASILRISDSAYTDATLFKNHFSDNDVIQLERATYLTSNTDLTSLTRINAQSNGTITLNNTDNVDMPNTVKSLKEVAK